MSYPALGTLTEYRVGPKGYIHGWIFVGLPVIGDTVFHPSFGHGKVHFTSDGKVGVDFGGGRHHLFEHKNAPGKPDKNAPPQPGRLVPRDPAKALGDFADRGQQAVLKMFPGSVSSHKRTSTMPEQGNESVAAYMRWDGTMDVRADVAGAITENLAGDGPLKRPSNHSVVLHELIHSMGKRGSPFGEKQDQYAYSNKWGAPMEEGFTQLGTTQHAAEFFDAMGISDRHAQDDPRTLGMIAQHRADPWNIKNQNSWGVYGEYTAAAQDWVSRVSGLEGHPGLKSKPAQRRMRELADEVNGVGVAEKRDVLASQVMRALNVEDKDTTGGRLSELTAMVISREWTGKGDSGKAFRAAVKFLSPWVQWTVGGKVVRMASTGPGRQAYDVLDWVYEDPTVRAGRGRERVNELARKTTDERALQEIQGVGAILARLASIPKNAASPRSDGEPVFEDGSWG